LGTTGLLSLKKLAIVTDKTIRLNNMNVFSIVTRSLRTKLSNL